METVMNLCQRFSLVLAVVAGATGWAQETRSFRMGFTPFPYALTAQAQQDVYDRILPRQDLIAHHLDNGVPWPEAASGAAYAANLESDLAGRLQRTPAGMTVYLATTPINSERHGLANYWGQEGNSPRPGDWADRDFDDPEVIAAYLAWCRDLLDRFQPLYFNYAIESTELAHNAPQSWEPFMTLVRQVYPALKAEYPDVQIFVSVTLRDPGTAEATAARPYIEEVLAYSDMLTVSTYRYLFGADVDKGNPATLPADWLSHTAGIAPDKPFGIAETAWLAETLMIPGLTVTGTPTWQADYLLRLAQDADALDARFVTWFLAVDYDDLYQTLVDAGLDSPVWLLWRDTGLWDGDVVARPARDTWDAVFARTREPAPPPVPDGAAIAGTALHVARAGSDLEVRWDVTSCAPAAADHHLIWLDLSDLPALTVADESCNAGPSGTWAGPPPTGDFLGVLAVANDGSSIEGSHGRASNGVERPTISTLCELTRKIVDEACTP